VNTFSVIEQEIVEMFTTIIEEKDAYTAGHSKRVALYSSKIAEAMGCSEDEQNLVYQAGLLHDIGKLLTPESILLKPRKFNRTEYAIIKNHSIDGEKMLSFISAFKPYMPLVRHHHEHYDGKGYPDGLKAEDIPFLSRILSVADAFDAMTTNRIYKPRKKIASAIKELQKFSGTQFDPLIVSASAKILNTYHELAFVHQLPETNVQEERFAYFYKDPLTSAYSGEYLNYFLENNHDTGRFACCYFIQLHHIHQYNKDFGWKLGDKLLKEVAFRLKILFHSSFIFRIFGDDFIVLNPLHVNVDEAQTREKIGIGFNGIDVSIKHFALKDFTLDTWENFEHYITHSQPLEACNLH
jgi:putative nucleotidyltransferase with HDIG domain